MFEVMRRQLLAFALTVAFVMTACTSGASTTGSSSSGWPLASGKKVCHIISLTNGYSSAVASIAKKEAKLLGLTWDVKDSKDVTDASLAIAQVESCIAAKYDVIAIVPYDPTALNATFQKATAAGIPVIQEGSPTDAAGLAITATYIGSNGLAEGAAAGNAICQALPNGGNWVLIGFPLGIGITTQRDTVRPTVAANCPNAKLLAAQYGNVNRGQGRTVMAGLLTAHPGQIDVVYCMNDDICMGAAAAIAAAGLTGKIKVLGNDFNAETAAAIKSGAFWGSILNDASFIGVNIVQRARDVLEGRPILKEYFSPATLITAQNLSKFTTFW